MHAQHIFGESYRGDGSDLSSPARQSPPARKSRGYPSSRGKSPMNNQSAEKLKSTGLPRNGDKKNSEFFETYLPRVLEERDRCGLTDMIGRIEALMITVEPGNSIEYIAELALMTPYHYLVTLDCPRHLITYPAHRHGFAGHPAARSERPDYHDIFRNLNDLHPAGSQRPHSRYLGRYCGSPIASGCWRLQREREFRFFSPEMLAGLDLPTNVSISRPSPYTQNVVGYIQRDLDTVRVYHPLGNCQHPPAGAGQLRESQGAAEETGHRRPDQTDRPSGDAQFTARIAKRRCSNIWALSSYYYWGSYDIADQNSSTNVCKSVRTIARVRQSGKSVHRE